MFGWRLLPWQRLVVDVVLELDDRGVFVYSLIVLIVPRQNAKTTTLFLLLMHALLLVAFGQGIYSAQTGEAARKKLVKTWIPRLDPKSPTALPFAQLVRSATKGVGSTGVELLNGSSLDISTSSEHSGHGGTNDIVVLDEFWADKGSNAREVALAPTTIVPRLAQTYIASIAGDWESTELEDKAKLGRKIVAGDGATVGPMAFFEWAADPGEEDWRSLRAAALCNPAFGRTVLPADLRRLQLEFGELSYRRQCLGQWTEGEDEGGVTVALWRRIVAPAVILRGYVALGIDGGADGSTCVVVAMDEAGNVRMLRAAEGTGWVAEFVAEQRKAITALTGRRCYVAARAGGVLRETARDLRTAPWRLGKLVTLVESADYTGWCSAVWEAVVDEDLIVQDDDRLRALVLGCTRRTTGDRTWAWAPRSVDLTVAGVAAMTLAHGELRERSRKRTRYYSDPDPQAEAEAEAGAA